MKPQRDGSFDKGENCDLQRWDLLKSVRLEQSPHQITSLLKVELPPYKSYYPLEPALFSTVKEPHH